MYQKLVTPSDDINTIVKAHADEHLDIRLYLTSGVHEHFGFKANLGLSREHRIVLRSLDRDAPAIIKGNPVGGSNTISLQTAATVKMVDLLITVDDTAMVKTGSVLEGNRLGDGKGNGRLEMLRCTMDGGFRADTGAKEKDSRWGKHTYDQTTHKETNCTSLGVGQEHLGYHHVHGEKPRYVLTGGVGKWCGRTDQQFIGRTGEGPEPVNARIILRNRRTYDTGLNDGGSSYTMRGGLWNGGRMVIDGCRVKNGCDASLHPDYQRNVRGGLVIDTEKVRNEEGVKVPRVWIPEEGPAYAIRTLEIDNSHFECGSEFPADRAVAIIEDVEHLFIAPDCSFIQHPGRNPYAALFGGSFDRVILGYHVESLGRISWNGHIFLDWKSMCDHLVENAGSDPMYPRKVWLI